MMLLTRFASWKKAQGLSFYFIVCFFAIVSTAAHAEFNYSVYDGRFNAIPDFAKLTPVKQGVTDTISTSVSSKSDYFGLVFTKELTVSTDVAVSFQLSSDDGSKLYVNDELVIDNDGIQSVTTATGSIQLAPGTHSFRLEYFEHSGYEMVEVAYSINGSAFSPIPASGVLDAFKYRVYQGNFNALPDFSVLTPIAQGVSETVSPTVTPLIDYFALVFTHELIVPEDETFTFYLKSDDGSRLYIDDQLVIDNDGVRPTKMVSGNITLTAGKHALRVEYFEKAGAQVLDLAYSARGMKTPQPIPPSGVLNVLPEAAFDYQVYSGNFNALPEFSTLTPIDEGASGQINVNVTPLADYFALVFTKELVVTSDGNFTFQVSSDDGSRLYIDDVLVVDNDGVQSKTTVKGDIQLSAGKHNLRVEYFEKNGGAVLDVKYAKEEAALAAIPTSGILDGFSYQVYTGDFNTLPDFDAVDIADYGISDKITTDVTFLSDHFGLVFTKALTVIKAGTYTFDVNSDDGSRLYINDTLVVDNDGLHGAITKRGTIDLPMGKHSLRVEYFEKTGGEKLDVTYFAHGASPSPIPASGILTGPVDTSFSYQVYSGVFNKIPQFDSLTPIAEGESTSIGTNVTQLTDYFGLVFTRSVAVIHEAAYKFTITSDDGSRLYINDILVANNDGLHGAIPVTGVVELTPGIHEIRVEYFEKNGGEALELIYSSNGVDPEPIPADGILKHVPPLERSIIGEWGPIIQWPEIAVAGANFPDGRVLTWSGSGSGVGFGASYTHASVFDPVTNTFEAIDNAFHNMFCSGLSMLEDGTVVASGGNAETVKTSAINLVDMTWKKMPDMLHARWYPTNVTLPNDTIFSGFARGAGPHTELYDPTANAWLPRSNISMQTMLDEQRELNTSYVPSGGTNFQWLSHLSLTPQGDIFSGGPTQTWHRFDAANNTNMQSLGKPLGDTVRMFGNSVTYDAGKVMLVGGSDLREETPSSAAVYLVDLNGPVPQITSAAPMNYPRTFNNTTVLPNGDVLVVGGNTTGKLFSDDGTVYPAEIYNPQTDTWLVADSIDVPRNYHSTGFLLKDGRVLAAGGGLCGKVCAANHQDGQIFSPPYLFNADNSLAERPSLAGVPEQVNAGTQIVVEASSDTTMFSMVRLSAHTHHINTDHRHLSVDFVNNNDGTFTLNLEANRNVLVQGFYWLFAVNAHGTPSMGETIQVIRAPLTDSGVDSDGDGVTDEHDAFPFDPAEWADTDGDGVGDNADAFPNDATETVDSDGDGVGDNSDVFPNDPTRSVDGVITPLPKTPRNSTTLLVESFSGQERIWNVNPDNASVSVTSASGQLIKEIPVGDTPWALTSSTQTKQVLVTNKHSSTISIVDTNTLAVVHTVQLPLNSQPHGIVTNLSGSQYYVLLEASAELHKYRITDHQLVASMTLLGTPRHLSMLFDDSYILVSNFITPPLPGESTDNVDVDAAYAEVFVVNPRTFTVADMVLLTHDGRSVSESQGPGMPNYLAAPVVSFDNAFAYVPSKKDNVSAGALRVKPGMTFEFTVRANASRINLLQGTEDKGFRVDFDNSSVATGAALSGDNRYVFVTLETSRELSVYDTKIGYEVGRLPTGRAPQSVALSKDGSRAYVHNFMDRTVTLYDVSDLLINGLLSDRTRQSQTVSVVSNETLAADVLLGKQFFYDAADDRLAQDNYMSCASCHKEAKHDGRVWDFTHLGEGLRNTTSLLGKGGLAQGMLHWTGNFDEVQDFEEQIRGFAGGTGLMSDAQFHTGTRAQSLGDPKAGVSAELDALAAYLTSLDTVERSPQPAGQTPSSQALAGKQVFEAKACASCHAGEERTDSTLGLRHDIGTLRVSSGDRLGQFLDGLDTPSLLGLGASAPYLHDGSAQTIEDAIKAHSAISTSQQEREVLKHYLLEIDSID